MKTPERFRYKAFISYSHAADGKLAPALQSALHKFAKPWYKLRAMRMFRDETNLAVNPHLWSNIVEALDDSEFFILLASPQGAQSNWVPKEVEHWLTKRPPETVLIVLTDGEIVWDPTGGDFDWTKTTALPRNFSKVFSEEPLYLDFRSMRTQADLSLRNPDFLSKIARLAAPLHGRSLDDLIGEDVQQHRRTKVVSGIAIAAILAGAMTAAWQAYVANQRYHVAVSRQLASQASSVKDSRWDLALLLAAEAYRNAPTLQARQSLHENFLDRPRLRKFLRGHSGTLSAVKFSPDGVRLVSSGEDKKIVAWEVATGTRLFDVTAHADAVKHIAFSRDGKVLVSAGKEGSIKIWDPNTGALVRAFGGVGSDPLETFVISPDGRRLVSALWSGKLQVWNVEDGSKIAESAPHTEIVFSVKFSPDGRTIASGSWDGTVALWDGVADHHPQVLMGHEKGAKGVAFSPDGKLLAVAYGIGQVKLWEVETGRLLVMLQSTEPGHDKSEGASVVFSPDGTRLALSGSLAHGVTVWDVSTQKPLTSALGGHEFGVNAIAFSHSGKRFASVGGDGIVRLWDTEHWTLMAASQGGSVCLAFSSDDLTLATCDSDRAVLWDVEEPSFMATLQAHTQQIGSIQFSSDGNYLASASYDRDVVVWDVRARKPVATYQPAKDPYADLELGGRGGKGLRVFAFSPNSRRLATGGREGKRFGEGGRRGDLVLWDFADGGHVTPFEGHKSGVVSLAFSPDGRRLVSADSGRILLWDPDTGNPRTLQESRGALSLAFDRSGTKLAAGTGNDAVVWDLGESQMGPAIFKGHERPVRQVLFSPDGKALVSASFDGTVRIWDTTRPDRALVGLMHHDSDINSIAMSADGRILATGSRDSKVGIWDARTGTPIHLLIGHVSEVESVTLRPDGAVVASAGRGENTTLWDVATGTELVTMRRPASQVTFSPDGKWLASGGGRDNRVTLWNASFQTWADRACSVANRNLTVQEWKQYLGDEPYRKTCPNLP